VIEIENLPLNDVKKMVSIIAKLDMVKAAFASRKGLEMIWSAGRLCRDPVIDKTLASSSTT
jgi:hypothetical protein